MIRYERGSTIIVVLIILLLVTIVGTLAIRESMSSLKLVSNNQMQALLLKNSDAALIAFQRPETTQRIAAANGIVGFFKNNDNWNKELIFCFKDNSPFDLSNASWLYWQDSTMQIQLMATNGGACHANDISAGRSQVITQVHVKRATSQATPFSEFARGTDVITAKTENNILLKVYVTSVMKGLLSNPNNDLFDIKIGCLNKSIDPPANALEKGQISLTQCLKDKNILFSTQVAEYRFLSDFEPSGS